MNIIHIDTRHLNDLWHLPVVRMAYKTDEGNNDGRRNVRLTDGDSIMHDTSDDTWDVILTTESYKFNARLPRTTKIK